jgi:hypothetical protein
MSSAARLRKRLSNTRMQAREEAPGDVELARHLGDVAARKLMHVHEVALLRLGLLHARAAT